MTVKKCPDCSILWDKTARGNQHRCPPCYRAYTKTYRARRKADGNPVISVRSSPEREREWFRRRRAQEPERFNARSKVGYAIKSGRLTRQPCAVCGSAPAEAHHDDYSRPLDVRWLCKPHHREHHKRALLSKES